MPEIRKTDVFAAWLDSLRDEKARARVLVRIERLTAGTRGTPARLEKGCQNCVSIMDLGIGCTTRSAERELIILLVGGDKASQANDIKTALRLARNPTE